MGFTCVEGIEEIEKGADFYFRPPTVYLVIARLDRAIYFRSLVQSARRYAASVYIYDYIRTIRIGRTVWI